MSEQARVKVDISEVQAAFDYITPEKLRTATRSAFNAAGGIMKRSVQKEYRSMFPGSVLYQDVHMKAFRSGKGVMVDLIYTRDFPKGHPLYKSFILPMLESGTIERYVNDDDGVRVSKYYDRDKGAYSAGVNLKQSNYRGRIAKGYKFFRQGVNSSIGRAQSKVETNIVKQIIKQAKKAGFETT